MMKTKHVGLLLAGMLVTSGLAASADAQRRTAALPASDLVIDDLKPATNFSFQWSLPARAGLYPALARTMRAEALAQLRADRVAAAANRRAGGQSGMMFWRSANWQVGADTSRLLALWVAETEVGGGASGNLFYRSRWWDKQTRRSVTFESLLADRAAAYAALQPAFCSALDSQRTAKRGGQAPDLPAYRECPALAEQVLVPQTIGADRRIALFSVKVAQGNVGPRSEGGYEVTVPVTAGFVAAVRPEWRASFRAP